MTHREWFAFISDRDDHKFAALADTAGAILIADDAHLLDYEDRANLRC